MNTTVFQAVANTGQNLLKNFPPLSSRNRQATIPHGENLII